MNKLFSRWLPSATLATWGAILLYFYASGRLQFFLAPTFRTYVPIAGVILLIMAAILALAPSEEACCVDQSCSHSLAKGPTGKILTFLILLVPITLSALVSPDSFGRTMIENRGIDTDGSTLRARKPGPAQPIEMPLPTNEVSTAPSAPLSTVPPASSPAPTSNPPTAPSPAPTDYLQRTPEGFIVAEVLDLLYAAQDNALRKDFEGKKVELVGQYMPDHGKGPGKRFKAVRMFMTCCAADARPVATLVEIKDLPDIPEMSWIKVTGTSTFPLENGKRSAIIQADKVLKTEPPSESLLY